MLGMTRVTALPTSGIPQELYNRHLDMADPVTRDVIANASHVIMVGSEGPCVLTATGLWTAVAVGMACRESFGGVLVDADTRVALQPQSFMELMDEFVPRALHFTNPQIINNFQGQVHLISLGMLHYGLPEIYIENVPIVLSERCLIGLIGAAQTIGSIALRVKGSGDDKTTIEFPLELDITEEAVRAACGNIVMDRPNSVKVRLELRASENGPSYISMVPPQSRSADFVGWINEFATAFTAPLPTTAEGVLHDQAMEQAHQRAMAELPNTERRFLSGEIMPGGMLVKYPFRIDQDQSEYMWVAVKEWGKLITGELVNQPHIRRDLRLGQSVTVDSVDVYDWLIIGPNGPEGGYTDQVRAQAAVARPPAMHGQSARIERDDVEPEFVKRRTDADFVRRVSEAGRDAADMEWMSRWKPARAHAPTYIRFPIIAFLAALGFAAIHIPVIAVGAAIVGIVMFGQRFPIYRRILGFEFGYRDVATRGEFRVAMPIMFNTSLKEPGTNNAPALMLMLPNDHHDPVAIYAGVAKGMSSSAPEDRKIAKSLSDEKFVPNKRFRIPPQWTGGVEVHAIGLNIERNSLENGVVDSPFIAVLAGPGEHGGVITLPWRMVQDALRQR